MANRNSRFGYRGLRSVSQLPISKLKFEIHKHPKHFVELGTSGVEYISTVNSQQSTVNSQQSTVNSQQSTVNSQQSTVTASPPARKFPSRSTVLAAESAAAFHPLRGRTNLLR